MIHYKLPHVWQPPHIVELEPPRTHVWMPVVPQDELPPEPPLDKVQVRTSC